MSCSIHTRIKSQIGFLNLNYKLINVYRIFSCTFTYSVTFLNILKKINNNHTPHMFIAHNVAFK